MQVPAHRLAQRGQISRFKMEHVWVEAWVDYFPGGGARQITGDYWVAMDASLKQYDDCEVIALDQQAQDVAVGDVLQPADKP